MPRRRRRCRAVGTTTDFGTSLLRLADNLHGVAAKKRGHVEALVGSRGGRYLRFLATNFLFRKSIKSENPIDVHRRCRGRPSYYVVAWLHGVTPRWQPVDWRPGSHDAGSNRQSSIHAVMKSALRPEGLAIQQSGAKACSRLSCESEYRDQLTSLPTAHTRRLCNDTTMYPP
jgi:hypothetical protein